MISRVARLYQPRELRWDEENLDPPEADEVLATTIYSAISPGTEMAAYSGAPPLRPMKVYPRVVGYCNVARVFDVGASSTGYSVGDIIVTHQSHRSSFKCGVSDILALVPESADLARISTAYLFHLGYSAVLKSDLRPGMSAAIVGLGAVGLGATAVAALAGARVDVFSNQQDLRDRAIALGASRAHSKIGHHSTGAFDVVISTSNEWADWKLSLELARVGGCIAVLGFPGRGLPEPTFNPIGSEYFYDKQLNIISCGAVPRADVGPQDVRFTLKRNMAWLVKSIDENRLDPTPLVSSTIAPSELSAFYDRLERREAGLVSAIIDWERA